MTPPKDQAQLSCVIPGKIMRHIDQHASRAGLSRTSVVILLLGRALDLPDPVQLSIEDINPEATP